MTMSLGDYIVAGILTAYLVGCVWYLAKTMEDKNGIHKEELLHCLQSLVPPPRKGLLDDLW